MNNSCSADAVCYTLKVSAAVMTSTELVHVYLVGPPFRPTTSTCKKVLGEVIELITYQATPTKVKQQIQKPWTYRFGAVDPQVLSLQI